MRSSVTAILCSLVTSAAAAQGVGERLDSVMRQAERNGFSGVVRIQRGDTVLLQRGYGLANRAEGIAFTPATVVQIGSNTKDFTAVAILQLQQSGRLSVKDSLGKYFAAAPPDKRNITIEQLLLHRAGFPLGLGGDFEQVNRQAVIDSAMHYRLLFTPGTRESYSNTGYSLLAAIVEQVTGQSYDLYVRDAILAPLGLQRTGFLLPQFQPRELAHGYLASGADHGTILGKVHAADGPYWNLRGNGGMLSTVGDMHVFYAALFSDRLLPPAARRRMFDADQPIGLAGSDLVSYFLYERDPRARAEMIIASTNAAMPVPAVRNALGRILGLPDVGGPGGGGEVAHREGGTAAPPPIAAALTELVRTINAGDTVTLRRFIVDHFASDPGAPTADERVQRLSGVHERLGPLTVDRIEAFADGSVEAELTSALQGHVVVRVTIDRAAPHRIHGLQIQVGGGG